MRAGFLICNFLGFVTYVDNLRKSLADLPQIEPTWILVPPSAEDIWERVPQFTFRIALRASAMLRANREPLDVQLVCTQTLGMFAIPQLRCVPTVISLDATPINFNEIVAGYGRRPPNSLGEAVKTRWNRAIFNAAHTVIAWSQWTARSVIEDYGINADKVEVIYPGIDLTRWTCTPRDASRERPLRLLFVGNGFVRKGGDLLLQALNTDVLKKAELDIVSNDEELQASERVRLHRKLTPNSPELRRLFAESDVFVLPTTGDTNPWVILEAMASGLPVISTRMAAIPELVIDGHTGLLIAPGDLTALVAAFSRMADTPSLGREMGLAGRERVEAEFDGKRNNRRTFAALEKAAASRASG